MIKRAILCLVVICCSVFGKGQQSADNEIDAESRLRIFIDTIPVFSTHEHFLDPEVIKTAGFLDFALLLLENGYNDLVSAGLPDSLFNDVFSNSLRPADKWTIIEPFWKKAFNTANNRTLMIALRDLYGVNELNSGTVNTVSSKMKSSYGNSWFESIIRGKSGIDYVIVDGKKLTSKAPWIKYSERFDPWITVRTKRVIDSLAIMQLDPIYTLEDFVKSMETVFTDLHKHGMVAVKIDVAYSRPIRFDNVNIEAARKVFRSLVNGDDETRISWEHAKPLQDYIVYRLLEMAQKKDIPVAIHTGFQSGNGNKLINATPTLLTNLFHDFPNLRFVLFHGAYPFGGELSTLAKSFRNVFIDMNWTYDISPTYSKRYLSEWLETVPVNKLMAFGGDQRTAEMTYGSLVIARKVIADVLEEKVSSGYFTESQAMEVARMILHDNAMKFYNIR